MKIDEILEAAWNSYQKKVANGLISPENEKMMQLQLARIFQTLAPIYEHENGESIKVLLEVPVKIKNNVFRSIDIVISHLVNGTTLYYPVELKCFRLQTRAGTGKRGAQNIGMYDYWEDIENIENYILLPNYTKGFQLSLTDDSYYVNTKHQGSQVAVYSTYIRRTNITGILQLNIANRKGLISLTNTYDMSRWQQLGSFYFVMQTT